MSKPFEDLHIDLNLLAAHPDPQLLRKALLSGGQAERIGLASLWLSEGIPYAFISSPAVYQQLRAEISNRLGIGIKDISVVGSSRVGYSLADYKFGKKFDKKSDLDLCIVNHKLFCDLKLDAEKFISDVKLGITTGDTPAQQAMWENSCNYLPNNICKGFIDLKKIPAIKHKYDFICNLKQSMYFVSLRLENTENVPKFSSLSIRFYKDWHSMVAQVSRSLYRLTENLKLNDSIIFHKN